MVTCGYNSYSSHLFVTIRTRGLDNNKLMCWKRTIVFQQHYIILLLFLIGMEQIIRRSSDQKAKVASVLLFTDGLANRGITKMKDIIYTMRDPIGSLAKPGVLDNAGGMARPLVSNIPGSLKGIFPEGVKRGTLPPELGPNDKFSQQLNSTVS